MTLPVTAGTDAVGAVRSTVSVAQTVKAQCSNFITRLQAGPVAADDIYRGVVQGFNQQMNLLGANMAVPGLDAQALALIPGYTGSMVADAQATANAMAACISWVMGAVPKDASDVYVLVLSWNSQGVQTWRMFSPAQSAPLVTLLQAVRATIN